MSDETAYWVALNHLIEIGPRRSKTLREAFPSAAAIWQAPASAFAALPGFSPTLAHKLANFCRQTDAPALYQQVRQRQIGILTLTDEHYPPLLRQIYDPPAVLYWLGQPAVLASLASEPALAMVGTRQATPYGRDVARSLAKALARQGVAIVSGLAYGIDAEAHEGALEAGGRTVAVMGSGVDMPHPAGNRGLYQQIRAQGLILSEFPPGQPPRPWTFPMRNRLVSGLSQAVIVVEAGRQSGTLITVDCAQEQGREIFAVPGPLGSPQSEGTNSLIQQGAHLLTQPGEIFAALGWTACADSLPPGPSASCDTMINLTNAEKEVYLILNEIPQHIDHIAERYPSDAASLASLLMMLELKGVLEQLPGKYFKIK